MVCREERSRDGDLASDILIKVQGPSGDRAIRAIGRPSQGGPTLENSGDT